jgi:predicted enzyme related to lactoylglutathione lyase
MMTIVMYMLAGLMFQAPAGGVIGVGNFSHIVSNLDRSLEFYRDVIGLELSGPVRPFDGNPAIMRLGNTPGAQSRFTALKVPGTALGVELIEYKDIDRKAANPRFQDPGAANLIVRVRDLNAVMARVMKFGARVLTKAGGPVTIGNGARVVFIQDPDGFIVELNQPAQPAATSDATGNVLGGAFELSIEDTDRTVKFYKTMFDFQPNIGPSFNGDKLLTDTAGTPGAQFRQSRLQIPGTSVSMTFIEFKDIDRKPLSTRVQDPGTAILQILVRDVDSLLNRVKANGGTVVSSHGEAVSIGTARIALVRDPNNLFLELIQR